MFGDVLKLKDTGSCHFSHCHYHGHFLDLFLIDQYSSLKDIDDVRIDAHLYTYLYWILRIRWENK
jgi:hypothetical protein